MACYGAEFMLGSQQVVMVSVELKKMMKAMMVIGMMFVKGAFYAIGFKKYIWEIGLDTILYFLCFGHFTVGNFFPCQ